MSFAGLETFNKNLLAMMDSDAFKKAPEDVRLGMGYSLLKSKYGIGGVFGFGRVHKLTKPGK